jgi:phage baseplate assembly protein W
VNFTFKSTGRETVDVLSEKIDKITENESVPIGIRTPVRPGTNTDGFFGMTYLLEDQLSDNLRNLIQTNHGERLGNYKLGANLRPLSIEILGKKSFESEAMNRISSAVSNFMPFISLTSMTVQRVPSTMSPGDLPLVVIIVDYAIPKRNIKKKRLEVIITLAG